jgi:hypothetical protein
VYERLEEGKKKKVLYGRRYSGQMRLKWSFLAIEENAMSGANPTPLITPRTPSPQ